MPLQEIEQHLVKQYSTNVLFLASQEESRLRGTTLEEEVTAEEKFFDQYGTVEMLEYDTRFPESPVNVVPRSSRRLSPVGAHTGEPIDSFDRARMLNDPTNPVVRRHAEAMGRKFDKTIIDAALGDALVGRQTPTVVPLPAEQVIAVDNHDFDSGTGPVGLTIGKLIAAKNRFGMSDVGIPNEGLHFVCTQRQISDLLTDARTGSIETNTARALVNGEINSYMGFTFHVVSSSLLPLVGTNRRAFAYARTGIVLGVAKEPESFISMRADRAFNWYAYFRLYIGATRTEETQVVEVLSAEA